VSGINVTITTSSPGVSIGGGTSVSVAVAGPTSPVAVSMVAGGSTTVPDITQLTAGDGITISTAANQFTISSYSTAQLGSYSPVSSVAGRTGAVVLQAADITTGTFSINRIPTISYTALSNVPQTFAPSAHTHSTADIVGLTLGPVQAHTHTTADIVAFTASAAAAAPVQSVAGRTGVITLSSADISGLAAVATSGSASDLSAGTLPAARLPVATADALGAIKVGSGLSIASGVLSATGGGGGGGATFVGVPTAGSATGTSGTFAADSTYLYACYSTNNWLRVQRAEWRWTPSVPISLAVSANDASGSTSQSPLHNVSATWQAPSDTGGGLSGYVVQLGSGTTATVSAQTLSFQWSNVTAGANACTTYEASVAAFNSAGTSSFANASAPVIPNTTYPVNLYVTATPNEGAPGVTYSASWVQVCLGGYNRYELQVRLYDSQNGAESNWETVGTPTGNSFTHYIGTATSNTVYEWRVRSITQVNGATTSSSIWSIIDTTPHP